MVVCLHIFDSLPSRETEVTGLSLENEEGASALALCTLGLEEQQNGSKQSAECLLLLK